MRQMRLFSDFDFVVGGDTIVGLGRHPRILVLLQRRLGTSLRRELMNYFINMLVCTFLKMLFFLPVNDT